MKLIDLIIPILSNSLRRNLTKSCGCLRHSPSHNRKGPFVSLYNLLKKNAESRKVFLGISYEDFLEYTKIQECHYCKDIVHWSEWYIKKSTQATNLDRKNSELGYTKDNVVVCCVRCNRAKLNHFSYGEWVEIGNFIRQMRERTSLKAVA